MKSFSEGIKDEILKQKWNKRETEIFLYSFMRTNARFNKLGQFVLKTTQKEYTKLFMSMIEEVYGVTPYVWETKKLTKFIIKDKNFTDRYAKQLGKMELKGDIDNTEEYAAYIKGAFVGKGWINDPKSKFYHLEIRVKDVTHSLDLQEVFESMGIRTTTILKNKWYYTYIKKSSIISDVLKIMGATKAMAEFENTRIERDFVSTIAKQDAVEPYNLRRTLFSTKKQVPAIKKLLGSPQSSLLTIDQRKLGELRVEKPELSLQQIKLTFNSRFDKNISRSTAYNWIRKMAKMGREI